MMLIRATGDAGVWYLDEETGKKHLIANPATLRILFGDSPAIADVPQFLVDSFPRGDDFIANNVLLSVEGSDTIWLFKDGKRQKITEEVRERLLPDTDEVLSVSQATINSIPQGEDVAFDEEVYAEPEDATPERGNKFLPVVLGLLGLSAVGIGIAVYSSKGRKRKRRKR